MKISKVTMLGVLVLSSLILVGCTKKEGDAGTSIIDTAKDKIADIVETDKSTYCVMSTTEGGTMEIWTKGDKTKVYGTNMGGGVGMGYMINDGEWIYMWVEGKTTGSKYAVVDEETSKPDEKDFKGGMPDIEMQQELAKHQVADFKQDCTDKFIPDSTFVPPSDVEFVDVMESMGKGLENFKQGL